MEKVEIAANVYQVVEPGGTITKRWYTTAQMEELIEQYRRLHPAPVKLRKRPGRPPRSINWGTVRTMHAHQFSWRAIAKAVGVSNTTLLRAVSRRIDLRGRI